MESLILGFNFYGGHDSSVCGLFEDDIYALSQERITRYKHDAIYPIDAIYEMIRYKKIDPSKIKNLYVGVASKDFENLIFNQYNYEMTQTMRKLIQGKRETIYIKDYVKDKEKLQNSSKATKLKTFLTNKHGLKYLYMTLFGKKITLKTMVNNHLKKAFPNAKIDIKFYEHHLTHAYGTYYASGFQDSLVFTFDGYGDKYFSKIYLANKDGLKEVGSSKNVYVPNLQKFEFADQGYTSVGNIYSIITYLMGFTPNADEGKVEALAAFGNHQNRFYQALINATHIDEINLSINLDADKLNALFAQPSIDEIFQELSREDIAAAVQNYTQEITLAYLKVVKQRYPQKNLSIAGGVSANVIMNMNIFENLFENLYILPAMGDDGISQGAAIMCAKDHQKQIHPFGQMPYYGSSYTKDEIIQTLKENNYSYQYIGDDAYEEAAKMICEGKVGALFHGRCEFGPRALGNRSIIADVRNKDIQKIINKDIKNRPLFQPFCPSMLQEERERLFEKAYDNKHMTIAFKLKSNYATQIPGAVHIDNTARVQFVSKKDNPNYYRLIKKVQDITGFGVIINTSFNKHGRTMVLTPQHALQDFEDTNLDFLVMEGFMIYKK